MTSFLTLPFACAVAGGGRGVGRSGFASALDGQFWPKSESVGVRLGWGAARWMQDASVAVVLTVLTFSFDLPLTSPPARFFCHALTIF